MTAETTAYMIVKGGRALLPGADDFQTADIVVQDGRIAQIGPDLSTPDGAEVIDATGKLVTPGLVDFHMHAFRYGHFLSIDADEVAHRSGTTTFVDAGSAGSLHFMAFREYVIKPAQANILAFLHVSAIGQTTDGCRGLEFHDSSNDALLHVESAREVIEKNRDYIVGVKVRAYTGLPSMLSMQRARELADMVDLPIMVHLAPAPPTFQEVIAYLKEGDIITHPYHGGETTILDDAGKIRPEYWEVRERGIEVDLGLDRFHGNLDIMRRCFDQGFYPDYLSTDLTTTNIDNIVFDMPTTIEKAVACGMPLPEAIRRSSATAAAKLGRADEIGSLKVGASADIAIFDLETTPGRVVDFDMNEIATDQRLRAVATYRAGRRMMPPTETMETLDVLNRSNPWANY
ncbi:MAG: amidohydrolase/deacetylase family metallohydrolase [Pseudomonadota bacterium]